MPYYQIFNNICIYMQKAKIICSLILLIFFINPLKVLAADNLSNAFGDVVSGVADSAGYNPENTSPDFLIANIIQVALSLLGVIFLVLMVYGGYLWMTAAGNEEKITKSKNLITAAIIGLIIVVSSYAISYFIVSKVQERAVNADAFK